ncbi:TCP-1/cpn60 chaperonin family protein [Hydrogenophaga sp. BPS33]|uniref:TCP-1/cpn60 chaperonin family protein n=1 Tax=Hydrogenophaga sp. BPS33 TaxID=2651974 RepID=UPI00131FC008|nr:TCP-1/cpn60 chaperonin family protein [Hydrogenophaga sp. BPS33]QHE86126.1 hypothetical protein F9K07_15040 [Hydrogenophaga sp. BPS33]
MSAKQLLFRDDARVRIRKGVDVLADAVRITLGPRGRTVVLERDFGAPQIVNSGVIVAKSIELEDRFENMGAQLMREVASRTSDQAGDGTTTATVLAHAMIHRGLRYLAGGMNPMELKRGMEQAIEVVVAELRGMARPCADSQEIAHVASISANNDRSIGALLAQAIDKVGAATETELKERKVRVEDALHATRAAIDEGIVPGGGVALLRARRALRKLQGPSLDHDSGIRLVEQALEEPLRCIAANAGVEPSVVVQRVEDAAVQQHGFNAATLTYGDMLQMGVLDPAKVTRLALQNAGSIAALVLTTDCMIAKAPSPQQHGHEEGDPSLLPDF